jgi:molybdopterin converting factor small subunit
MNIKVLFFGKLADIAQTELGSTELDISEKKDINALIKHISTLSPKLHDELKKPANLTAVNQVIHKKSTKIQPGDEVAFMSPLSGG